MLLGDVEEPGEMRAPGVVEFAGVGHAPMLLAPDQYGPVVEFLRAGA